MASKYWIKLYHEILEDPKMGRLPDNVWRRAIELFLMAGELDDGGRLPDTEAIAWKLRLSCNETLHNELRILNECNVLSKREDGSWLVTNFAKRQKANSTSKRVAEFRKRQRKQKDENPDISVNYTDETGNYPENPVNNTGAQAVNYTTGAKDERSNVSLHESYTDIDKDIDSDKDKESTTVGASLEKSNPVGPKTMIKDEFLSLTNLSWPKRKSDQKFWWSNFQEVLSIANKDCDQALKIQKTAIQHAIKEKLTISGPQSIVNLCRSVQAGQLGNDERVSPITTPTPGWQTDVEIAPAEPVDPVQALKQELWRQLEQQTQPRQAFLDMWSDTELIAENDHYVLVPPSPQIGERLQRFGIPKLAAIMQRQGCANEIVVR